MSFFLGSLEINLSTGKTNRVNQEAVLRRFFVPCSDSFPMNPEKKTLICYIYNVSIENNLSSSPRKSHKFIFSVAIGTYNLIWCKSLCMWFANCCKLLVDCVHREWTQKFLHAWFNEGDIILFQILTFEDFHFPWFSQRTGCGCLTVVRGHRFSWWKVV